MAAISTVPLLHQNGHHLEITKVLSHKTVYLLVISLSNLSMHSLDGRDLLQMPEFMKTHAHMIFLFHLTNIILPMLVFLIVISFLFHIEVCGIILLNGAVQISGDFLYFLYDLWH